MDLLWWIWDYSGEEVWKEICFDEFLVFVEKRE